MCICDIIGEEIQYGDRVAQAQGKRLPDLVVAIVQELNFEKGYVRTNKGWCFTPGEKLLVIGRVANEVSFPHALQMEM